MWCTTRLHTRTSPFHNLHNDFSNNIKTDITILADDTALLCSGNDKDDLKSNIITNLENVETLVLSQQTLLI